VAIRRHAVRLPAGLEQVARARRVVAQCLGTVHPRLDDARLLTSEAVTNSLLHSASGAAGGLVTLTVDWTDAWVQVTVGDEGSATVPYRVNPSAEDVAGRGVELIDQLAVRWGFVRRRAIETRVWFELAAHAGSAITAAETA
jgi:anti-sigma regulatory factor (Ser/Thr protein kinase)